MISQIRHQALTVGILATATATATMTLLQAIACTPKIKAIVSTNSSVHDDLFSNRPIGAMEDLFIITLSSPPILGVAKKQSGHWNVPANAKKQLLNEQSAFEKKLKALAPDAQIIYRYHMTINALAIYTSSDVASQLMNWPGVSAVNAAQRFDRAEASSIQEAQPLNGKITSVNFIGTDEAHKLGFSGQGMRVGIIDTGIDYTHSMLGGSGKKADFEAINPALPNSAFPNDKVVGGIDLVGTDFNPASPVLTQHIPHIDANPIDEAGHGSHVAGTIAGHGDGVNTYDGVAPDAELYAIKVFGKKGSTADAAVIAGFEFAADPNGDLNPDDQLDVVNLSLGGGFGQPHTLYSQAVHNLSRSGTVVVVSAGNAGAVDYIVGAPSTSDDAISVAASIDGSLVNWQFHAVQFSSATNPSLFVKALEGPISLPIAEAGPVAGTLVDIGFADTDLSDTVKAQLAGKVAFIQRGKVSFVEKLQHAADAGAIGAVVFNNDGKAPGGMGGEGNVKIPAIMISQALGLQLQQELATAPVNIQFQTDQIIKEPGNIDTITDFSSKGPRSEDNLIKPEVAAPGQNITSVKMGSGNLGVKMDGTSMAAPHLTGAVTLIRQARHELSAKEVKSLLMNTSKVLTKDGETPITLQGAGRVQVDRAISSVLVSETPSLSLGRVQLNQETVIDRRIELRNLSDHDVVLNTEVHATEGMKVSVPSQVTVLAKGYTSVNVTFTLKMKDEDSYIFEMDGRILFKQGEHIALQIPAMAIRAPASMITATAPKQGAVTLTNASANAGLALAFNLLGQDAPKPHPGPTETWKNRTCDLQSAGYRILRKTSSQGSVDVIQFAFKVYQPVTTWIMCSVSVLIDSKGNGVPDQELAGVTGGGLEGVKHAIFSTVLLDSAVARILRFIYEQTLNSGKSATVDYSPAVIGIGGMAAFNQSTLAVIESPLDALNVNANGQLNIKLATQAEGTDTFQADKFLGGGFGTWIKVSPKLEDQSYYNMEETTTVGASASTLTMSKGSGTQKLVLYYPLNDMNVHGTDLQQQVF